MVGIYRVVMKQGSDNFRASAVQEITNRLKVKGIKVVIYELAYEPDTFFNYEVLKFWMSLRAWQTSLFRTECTRT